MVNFEDVNAIKRKAVRGLLRKRAKKYTEAEHSSDSDIEPENSKRRKVQRATLSDAFKFIMNKEINEPGEEENKKEADQQVEDVMLSKYKKRARVV